MEKVKGKIFSSALGVSGGLAGLAFISRCPGNACASCMGCAWAATWILFIAAIKKLRGGLKKDGMA